MRFKTQCDHRHSVYDVIDYIQPQKRTELTVGLCDEFHSSAGIQCSTLKETYNNK